MVAVMAPAYAWAGFDSSATLLLVVGTIFAGQYLLSALLSLRIWMCFLIGILIAVRIRPECGG